MSHSTSVERRFADTVILRCERLLEARGWRAFDFQREVWTRWIQGQSGVLHATTGSGKSIAASLAPLAAAAVERETNAAEAGSGLQLLWITPLRALATDTAAALESICRELGLSWRVETRTGDTPARTRRRQKLALPQVLVTTPESVSILLSHADAPGRLGDVRTVVVDEWHELLSTKRGTQTELVLARLRRWQPRLRTWGLSATLGNLEEALAALLGDEAAAGALVYGDVPGPLVIDSVIPKRMDRFPWAGHLGLGLAPQVAAELDTTGSCLVFANTRSQVERWYHALLSLRPELAGELALHHGSLDRAVREYVEAGIKHGTLRCVVCTSSLDLGVDFHPVERVFQVGSPKGVARLLQRAGRSGHRPGATSRVTCVPTHAFELIECHAAREAARAGKLEPRVPLDQPLDVLAQHVVTIAVGTGFEEGLLYDEVRSTHAYRSLDRDEWYEVLRFASSGGDTLRAYDEHHRLVVENGQFVAASEWHARRHRLMIGTIASDSAVTVKYANGATLGTIEESFLTALSEGDRFLFSGRTLELQRIRGDVATVRRASGHAMTVPRWLGGSLPLSTHLAKATREAIAEAGDGRYSSAEMRAVAPLLELQRRVSVLPAANELLVERLETREGHHLFLFPFEGRASHEGLGALLAWRLARRGPQTFSVTANDYALELLSADPIDPAVIASGELFTLEGIEEELLECVNAAELAKREFRSIARVAGLQFQGYPGRRASSRHLTASASLLFDVFSRHEPDHFLLRQARRDVLERRFELGRLRQVLERAAGGLVRLVRVERPSPLAFPVLAERVRSRVSSESVEDRLRRMVEALESRYPAEPAVPHVESVPSDNAESRD